MHLRVPNCCLLMAQGGCESQLTAHAKGNMNLGNTKEFLIKVYHSICRILVIQEA